MKTPLASYAAHRNDINTGRRQALKLAGWGIAALGVMPLINFSTAKAQDMTNGANNFYTSDKVALQKVTFKNQYNMNVAGTLFTPKSLNRSSKAPAIVVGHPMGAVKEQSANLYATMMAERGFVAMSIDLPFWGESEGQTRNMVRQTCTPKRSALPSTTSARSASSTEAASVPSESAAAAVSSLAPPKSTLA